MDRKRLTGLVLVAGCLLFPPWTMPNRIAISIGNFIGRSPGGTRKVFAPLWHAPSPSAEIDVTLWLLLLAVAGIIAVLMMRKKTGKA